MDPNRYRHPFQGPLACVADAAANSVRWARLRRLVFGRLPFPVLASDVTDVVYVTWLVDVTQVRSFVPPEAVLWEREGLTPFTVLTYRHGHFGPRALGPLRWLCPSPQQSNWRLYLEAPLPGAPKSPTVVFVKNILDSTIYALGTRLFSDALPSHRAAAISLTDQEQVIGLRIDPGTGSAPSLAAQFDRHAAPELPDTFRPFANSWEQAIERLATQEAAVAPVPSIQRTAVATIDLPVDMPSIEPLRLQTDSLSCPFLNQLGASSPALAFRLPRVHFQALSERLL
ncbi:DUF2071 domain-containing protein [Inhella gelatinilytica]|uniref:DUF2071 domain-containing protein n=1 Tax=Inhella gelatinilytica TaxID=2795030 RepID=A0A931NDA0_9BURK|nr:DUF2071 domain-containing protein [Inhella gelatinilytica]MBH9552020.1 DUF2071 domain-containing protein [Inhella gelatinilytica]